VRGVGKRPFNASPTPAALVHRFPRLWASLPRRARERSTRPAAIKAASPWTRAGRGQNECRDRLTDETGEYEVIGRPYTTNAGKTAHVRVKKAGQPEIAEIRSWGAHERVSVRRVRSAEEGKR
jgi:hypothetical protein